MSYSVIMLTNWSNVWSLNQISQLIMLRLLINMNLLDDEKCLSLTCLKKQINPRTSHEFEHRSFVSQHNFYIRKNYRLQNLWKLYCWRAWSNILRCRSAWQPCLLTTSMSPQYLNSQLSPVMYYLALMKIERETHKENIYAIKMCLLETCIIIKNLTC